MRAPKQTAELLLAAATRVRTGTVEAGSDAARPEWIARLTLVVEPRLPGGAAYLAADSSQIDTIELGLLASNEFGPMVEEERGFVIDAISFKVRHVFGAKAVDWRGLVKIDLSGS